MSVTKEDASEKKKGAKYLYIIPIGCAVFTFVYWFIMTPLLWSAVDKSGQDSFSLFLLTLGALWVAIVGMLLLFWCFKYRNYNSIKDKRVQDRVSIVKKDSNASSKSNSPSFPTKAQTIQPPDTPISYKPHCSLIQLNTGSEKDNVSTISLNSWPVQPQNTPSLYDAQNGRQSYDHDYPNAITVAKKPSSIDALEKQISSSSSSSSLSETNVDSVDDMNQPEKIEDEPKHERTTIVETHEMPRLSSKDSFQGLPEMKDFDGYLHLTTVDTPLTPPTAGDVPDSSGLTPREIFFSDLIQQAEESEHKGGDRRSFCIGDSLAPREVDKRKSMPLFLYYTSSPPPYEETKPLENKDLESVADSEDYSLSSPSQKVTNDELKNNLERFDFEQTSALDEAIVPKAEANQRHSSSGEFFIANVAPRTKNLMSEVRIDISGDSPRPTRDSISTMEWRIVGETPETLSIDNEGYASDDCVFEDDVKLK